TSTAQSEIIGRRHYGRKAIAAGGGGGRGSTRELFDTLLVWKAQVALDANGEATVEVPLNDSLTSFRLVAVADAQTQKFGTGSTRITVTQDLQVLAGLPPLVREGDQFSALLTLRNTTARDMTVRALLQGSANSTPPSGTGIARSPLAFAPQDVVLPAGSAKEITWPIGVPADAFSIAWEAAVEEQGGGAAPDKARDRIKLTQLVVPAVPVRVLQATLQQLDGAFALPIAAPADALPESGTKRGGITVAVQPKLSGALPGLRRFFETYPFICLEQKASKSVGLKDVKLWAAVANSLPTYLDSDGLASYFPPRAEDGPHGSDRLTAYVLAATHEAGFELPAPARDAMLAGLAAFVEGRIERKFWSPRADLDVRKLAALEALSRYGRAQPKMLGSVNLTPNVWPTAALIDWLNILRRVPGIPDQARRLEEAQQILRGRLTYAGTTLKFSTEESDFWWWLMDSADANAARLILAVLDDPSWKDDLPRLVVGSLGRQRAGAWLTTTANLWGSLALDKFAARFESAKIGGRTTATTGDKPAAVDWAQQAEGGSMRLPWPAKPATLNVAQEGTGKPWLSVQSLAAIPLKAPLRAGYAVARSVSAVEQKDKGKWSRGDVVRVRLEVDAQSDMTWVVVSDPVPGGATILGSGLGRDSAVATRTEKREGSAWAAAYEERSFEAFRSYFEYLPKGRHVIEYTLRLNNPGRFALPPTRVDAMYAPESFGEAPNAALEIAP
ncbi:MAG TPA: alpha-2-macroglobulin family protein, partial [Caldimonas sp.]